MSETVFIDLKTAFYTVALTYGIMESKLKSFPGLNLICLIENSTAKWGDLILMRV